MTDSITKDMNLGFQFLDLTNIPDEEANRIKNVLKDNSRDRPVFFLQDQYKWKEKDKQEAQDYIEVKYSSVSNKTSFEPTEEEEEVKAEQQLPFVFAPARHKNDNPVKVEVDPTPSEPVAPAPKSWASLFKAPAVSKVSAEPVPPPVQTPPAVTPPPANCDPDTYKLAMHLNNYALVHEGLNLQPRGLLNKGNYCYINAVLQGLMGCPPFYNMIRAIEPIVKMKDTSAKPTPVMETLYVFNALPLSDSRKLEKV